MQPWHPPGAGSARAARARASAPACSSVIAPPDVLYPARVLDLVSGKVRSCGSCRWERRLEKLAEPARRRERAAVAAACVSERRAEDQARREMTEVAARHGFNLASVDESLGMCVCSRRELPETQGADGKAHLGRACLGREGQAGSCVLALKDQTLAENRARRSTPARVPCGARSDPPGRPSRYPRRSRSLPRCGC